MKRGLPLCGMRLGRNNFSHEFVSKVLVVSGGKNRQVERPDGTKTNKPIDG